MRYDKKGKGWMMVKLLGKDGFLSAINTLIGQQDSKLLKTLEIIIGQTDKEKQRWINSKGNRNIIKNKTEKSEPTVNRYISRLAEAGIIIKMPDEGRGIYKFSETIVKMI